jgi:hypothetical protein
MSVVVKILPRISVTGISIKILPRIKNPAKDFCSEDLNVRRRRRRVVVNCSLDLAARAIVLQAFLFD